MIAVHRNVQSDVHDEAIVQSMTDLPKDSDAGQTSMPLLREIPLL